MLAVQTAKYAFQIHIRSVMGCQSTSFELHCNADELLVYCAEKLPHCFLHPHRLWLETVNVLRPPETQVMQPLTHQNLTEDPLIVLRCDPHVFRYTEVDYHQQYEGHKTLQCMQTVLG